MNLFVLNADLVNKPSEVYAIRTVALVAATLDFQGLIETEKDYIDIYWKFCKQHHLNDFFKEMVTPQEAPPVIRIDKELNYPLSIITDRITLNNQMNIIVQFKSMCRAEATAKVLR